MEKYAKLVNDMIKEIEAAKSAYISAQQAQIEANKAAAAMKEEIRKSLVSMRSTIDDQYYKMMSPEDRRKETQRRFLKGTKDYYDAMRDGNAKLAEDAVKILTKNYDELYQNAQKKLEDNKKTMETLQKMQVDAMLQSATTDAQKFAIYQQEQQKWQKDAADKLKAEDFAGAAQSWQKASDAARQMISIQNKLAQAEMNANEGTRRMILELDKFKSHAMGFVDTFSVKAVELRSRRFDNLPEMKESTTMQETSSQLNRQFADETQKFIKDLRDAIAEDNAWIRSNQDDYDRLFKYVSDSLGDRSDTILKGFENIKETLKNTQFKVKIEQGFPTINTVRL